MSGSDVATILAELRALQMSAQERREKLDEWTGRVELILKRQDSELLSLRSRQDETDYRLRRLVENTLNAPSMWRMALVCGGLAGAFAFAAVLIGQLIQH